ncbi:MAG: metallophosphoesterase family protein [Pyrinomonadaceae bacterium]
MRKIVHLSDIHFGRIDAAIIEPLVEMVANLTPNVVAISGDLTQRARSQQFIEARAFLDRLPKPQIVVPGNHDIPLHNIFSRFFRPLDKYRRYVTDDLQPFYSDDEIAVLGINTARSLTVKGGRINEDQIRRMREKLWALGEDIVKVIVTHHPFDLPETHDESDIVGRSQMAMNAFAECGVDVFLAGHLHLSHTGHTAARYKIKGHSALVVQAGTATSTRGRGESNSFNVISVDQQKIAVERFTWLPEKMIFTNSSIEFLKTDVGWVRTPDTENAI